MATYTATTTPKRGLIVRTVTGARTYQKRHLIIRTVNLSRLKSTDYVPPPPTKGQIFPRGIS